MDLGRRSGIENTRTDPPADDAAAQLRGTLLTTRKHNLPKRSSRSPTTGQLRQEVAVRITRVSFGAIRIDGITHEHDVVIDRGKVGKRKKKPSKQFRDAFGHTPLSLAEEIPWKCHRLVVGTGVHGGLPVMEDVKREAEHRNVELLILPTAQAIEALKQDADKTNAILHVTC